MKLTSVAASIAAALAPVAFGQDAADAPVSAPSVVQGNDQDHAPRGPRGEGRGPRQGQGQGEGRGPRQGQGEGRGPKVRDNREMQWYFTEGVEIYTFKGDGENILALKQTLGLDLGNGLNLKFVAPIYSQGDSMSFGDLNLGASVDLASGKNDIVGSWDLAVGGGVYIPTGVEQFRSENVNPYINAAFDCDIWVFDFKQTAEFAFNGGETFLPLLGTKVDTDVLTFGSDLTYKWGAFDVGLALDQYYYVTNGEKQLFLGPTAKWDIASNLTLNLGVGIPVYQDVSTPESNAVVTAGFGIKF